MESQEFSQYLGQIYDHGTVMLAIAFGHDLGLFKLLCNAEGPLSVTDIADKTGLKERYTKEWLSSMVAAKIIHQDRATDLYTVPEGHKQKLKLRASYAQSICMLSDRRDDIKSCFSKDGPYGLRISSDFFDWFDVYRAESVDHIMDAELIPKLTEHGMVPKLEAGIEVVDIGCGTGILIIGLAKRFPNTHFTALDYSETALTTGRDRATKDGVENVTFIWGDAHNLPDSMSGCFDLVFAYEMLHDLPDPHKALTQIHKIMKQDGYFSLVEAYFHSNPCDNVGSRGAAMHYIMSMFVCLPSSMSEENRVGYGACWGHEEVVKALHGAGFKILGDASSIRGTGSKNVYFCLK